LKRLGYSAVERARLEQDRKLDQGASMLEEIAHSMEARALRTEKAVTADAAAELKPTLTAADVPGATPAAMPKKMPVSVPANK